MHMHMHMHMHFVHLHLHMKFHSCINTLMIQTEPSIYTCFVCRLQVR